MPLSNSINYVTRTECVARDSWLVELPKLCFLSVVWPWASQLIPLRLKFSISEMVTVSPLRTQILAKRIKYDTSSENALQIVKHLESRGDCCLQWGLAVCQTGVFDGVTCAGPWEPYAASPFPSSSKTQCLQLFPAGSEHSGIITIPAFPKLFSSVSPPHTLRSGTLRHGSAGSQESRSWVR